MDEVWRESMTEQRGDSLVRVLAPHHEVLYLALHAFKHSYNKRSLFTDIQKTIEHYAYRLDWERVLECARCWNAATPLYYSLKLTEKITTISLPHRILETIKPKKRTNLIPEVLQRVREERLVTENLVYWIWFDMVKGFSAKLRFLFLTLFR
jgi:hypothetical protein